MASDERNFCPSYYEKVGFTSVEERKSLEILLKEKPLDRDKLRQFCLRFSVPGMYRSIVWKVLLGIVSIHVDTNSFIISQRQQEYANLLHALKLMRIVDDHTPKPQRSLLMWLLQSGRLKLDWLTQLEGCLHKNVYRISQSVSNLFEDDVDVYWISKGLFQCVTKFYDEVPKLIDDTKSLLEKEDNELYRHLEEIKAFNALPFHDWLSCCFAGILYESALAKVWDKIAGGAYNILVFVSVVLVLTFKRQLMKCSTSKDACNCITDITEEMSDILVSKAFEMWQQYGSELTTGMNYENVGSGEVID